MMMYLRVEISFFNKLFDEADLTASIRSKCFFATGSQRNELSNYVEQRTILKDENIVFVRHSWAMPSLVSIGEGNDVWEAYIDEVKIGEANFLLKILLFPELMAPTFISMLTP